MRKIWRFEIPADDLFHRVNLQGEIVHIGTRRANCVEVWALIDDQVEPSKAMPLLRVFGTGQPLPDDGVYLGTAVVPNSTLIPFELVWHLFRFDDAGA